MSTILSETRIKKTRKLRRCEWCGEIISVGSSCYKVAAIHEDGFGAGHYHEECHDGWKRTDWRKYEFFDFGENDRGKAMQEQ